MQHIGNVTFVCGPHGCGKSYLGELLSSENRVLLYFECGPAMRKLHEMSSSPLNLHEWISECNALYETNYVEKRLRNMLLDAVSQSGRTTPVIISGVRSMNHIRYLCEPWGISNPYIVYIDCDYVRSKQNCMYRENGTVPENRVDAFLRHDYEMGLSDIKVYVLENPGECTLLLNDDNHIDKYMKRIHRVIYRSRV